MLNQYIEPLRDLHSSPNKPKKDKDLIDLGQNENQNHSQMMHNSYTPVKLSDTFRRLIFTMEQGNTIMQGCTNVVSTINEQVAPAKTQYLGDRKDKVTVELKCAFMQIMNIATVQQVFEAEVFVRAKWQEPALQKASDLNDESLYDPTEFWIPRMTVLNSSGSLKFNRRNFTCHFNQKGYKYPVVTLLWRFKGTFRESLELEHFPFDCQDLTVQLSTERSSDEVELIEDQHSLCTVNTKSFQDAGEWDLYEHVETFQDLTTQEYVSSTIHPILFAQCRVKRKIGFYMWNIVFIVALIAISTFCMVTEPPDAVDRMYNNVTLLMTAFIFKMAIHQSLPTISYLTYLDVYVLVTLVFLGLQIAENSLMACISKHVTQAEVITWDYYAMSVIFAIFVLFNLSFLTYIYLTAYKRRRCMEQKDRLYQAKKRHLEKYGVMLRPSKASALDIKMSKVNLP